MTDFTKEWPVLTRFGEHEEIMKRLALYMDWGKVEEPEQADLLLDQYKKDVGRLIRTLTHARTPTSSMAGEVLRYAQKISCSPSDAINIMFFIFRAINADQGIPLGHNRFDYQLPENWDKITGLLESIVSTALQDGGGLPCVACREPFASIPELLDHILSAHPHLNEGDRDDDAPGE